MNKSLAVLLASAMLSAGALAQTSVNSQTDVSGSQNASVSAGRDGATAQSDTSAQASQQTSVTHKDADREERPSKANSDDRDGARRPSKSQPKSHDGSQSNASGNSSLTSGSTINAVLTKPVDSRRCKDGDPVFARTTSDTKSDGNVVIPKGSRLVGHVTEAKASTKDDSTSKLGIVFDRAVTKDGQEVPMHTVVQAVASAQNMTSADMGNDTMMSQTSGAMSGTTSASGGLLRGVSSGVGATAGTVTSAAAGTVGGVNSTTSATNSLTGTLTPNSTGVLGMPGINLASDASNAMQGSVFTCKDHNVRLATGTQMMLKVVGE